MKTFLEYLQQNPGRDSHNLGKRSKDDEVAHGSDSNFKKTYVKQWDFVPSIHAASQAKDRRPDFSHDDWKKLHTKIHNHLESLPADKKKNGEHLFHVKSADQSYVAHVDHPKKTVRIITVLPKGKHNAKEGTDKHTMESVNFENLIIVELE